MKSLFLTTLVFPLSKASATLAIPSSDEHSDIAAVGGTHREASRSLRPERLDVTKKEHGNDQLETANFLSNEEQRALTSSSRCKNDEKWLRIDITTDDYGFENDWELYLKPANGNGAPKLLYSGPPDDQKYGKKKRYVGGYCLGPGTYKFAIKDLFKDGMCCDFGEGSYAGYIDDKKIFSSPSGSQDWEKRGHQFIVPKPSDSLPFESKIGMTARNKEWLDSHNSRRKSWHQRYSKSYVPLRWSTALEEEARVWAEKLAVKCTLVHDSNSGHGENIALNYGWGGKNGEMRPTDDILTRFVENEADDSYPDNGHLTQVLWRATKWVGCADASSPKDGGHCHTQVCRYTKPGNCNMGNFKSNKNNWWLQPMLLNDSPCGKECPPDGCNYF